MKCNYRRTWERGYLRCHVRCVAEGCFAEVMAPLSRGTKVSALKLKVGRGLTFFALPSIGFIIRQLLCPL